MTEPSDPGFDLDDVGPAVAEAAGVLRARGLSRPVVSQAPARPTSAEADQPE